MIRRTFAFKRGGEEDWVAWAIRSTRKGREVFLGLGHRTITTRVLTAIHRRAISLTAPIGLELASGFLNSAIDWRSTAWWHAQQALSKVAVADDGAERSVKRIKHSHMGRR